MSTNGSGNGKNGNGHDPDDDDKNIVKFPSLAERDKLRREERAEEEKWRKEYRKKSKAARKANAEPFFKAGNIPPFARALMIAFWVVHLPLYIIIGDADRYQIFETFGFVPGAFTGTLEWHWAALLSPLTHGLIHGSWMHLFFNSVMGMVLCMFFEKIFGARTTALFFILCILAGALLYFGLSPTSTVPVIGASGGISGLFAALIYIMMTQNTANPMAQRFGKHGPWPVMAFWGLVIVVPGLLMGDGVAWQAHLGGYIAGIALLIGMQKGKIRL